MTRQSKAQHAKHASAALFNASKAAAKSRVAGPGWGWVCNEVCNGYVTRSITRQSKAQYAKRLRSSSLIAAIQHKPGCGKKRAVMSLARFVHLRCVTRVCNEGVPRGVCNEGCVTSQLVLLQRSVTRSVTNVRRGSVTDPSKKFTAISAVASKGWRCTMLLSELPKMERQHMCTNMPQSKVLCA